MEAFVDTFVEAPVEVTSVEAFIYSISSLEASTKAFMKASVDVLSMKAAITSTKASVTSMAGGEKMGKYSRDENEGTYRSEEGEGGLLCDPGSELLLGGNTRVVRANKMV